MTSFFRILDDMTSLVAYYFFLGGPVIAFLISLFFLNYSASDFFIWLSSHFVMVLGLSVVYHRYFAHRSYEVNRFVQFLMGLWGTLCLQRGPIWWSSIHRMHHRHCGTKADPHTPSKGPFHSHFKWVMMPEYKKVQWNYVQDLAKYPELRFLEYSYLFNIPVLSLVFFSLGGLCAMFAYQLAVCTALNTIACVNSVCHEAKDEDCAAKNVGWVAFFGAGEGYHANHHDHPGSAKFGIKWYQIDLSYILLRILSMLGIVKKLKVTTGEQAIKAKNIS